MPVRLKDIADDLNLSTMTISKVLRGQTDVSAATKERVLKRVKELNYRPNLSASSLRTGQTMTMGLILPSIRETYLAEIAGGVDQIVRAAGYSLVVCPAQDDPELEQRQIELLLARQADALLVVSVQENPIFFNEMRRQQGIPLVFVNRKLPGTREGFVGVHEEEVGRIACEHLIECGCRRIAYLRGPRTTIGDLRSNGFRQALSDGGQTFHSELVIDGTGTGEGEYRRGFDGMTRVLSRRGRPDGVMAYSDMMAVGAMDAALNLGVKIPEGIAFIGSGNDTRLCEMRIALSSMDTGGHEVGQRAGRLALRLITDGQTAGPRRILVTPRLIKRHSTTL